MDLLIGVEVEAISNRRPAHNQGDGPATMVVSHEVFPDKHEKYEEFLKELRAQCRRSPGHLGAEVFRPYSGAPNTYTVIVRFDTQDHLNDWLESAERKAAIDGIGDILVGDFVDVRQGFDLWFTPTPAARTPRRAKQYLLTVAMVFPLTLILPVPITALAEFVGVHLPFLIKHLLVVMSLVGLMVYVLFPHLTRALSTWLAR